ncbi:hypothetical protein ON010_g7768 [Phytophthora cinnamomi]|nr:hypothetical protein ON010_g7768 [Phytophthora cinnamomi]
MDELRQIHEGLFKLLNLAAMDTLMDWKKKWEEGQRVQQETLLKYDVEILNELADARARRETMMNLQFQTQQRADRQNEEMLALLSTVANGRSNIQSYR